MKHKNSEGAFIISNFFIFPFNNEGRNLNNLAIQTQPSECSLTRFKSIGIIRQRVLRFIRNLSIIQAGLREAARVLAQLLWASGLQCKFACFTTILQSKRPAYKSTRRKNPKITLITLET
jgi:hypothetical protein